MWKGEERIHTRICHTSVTLLCLAVSQWPVKHTCISLLFPSSSLRVLSLVVGHLLPPRPNIGPHLVQQQRHPRQAEKSHDAYDTVRPLELAERHQHCAGNGDQTQDKSDVLPKVKPWPRQRGVCSRCCRGCCGFFWRGFCGFTL